MLGLAGERDISVDPLFFFFLTVVSRTLPVESLALRRVGETLSGLLSKLLLCFKGEVRGLLRIAALVVLRVILRLSVMFFFR